MKRREFLTTAGTAALGLTLDSMDATAQPVSTAASPVQPTANTENASPTYVVLGVPLRAGSLYPGNENDAQAYRDADGFKGAERTDRIRHAVAARFPS